MIVTSNLIKTPKVVTIDQNRWSRSVKFTGHDLLEWVVTVDQNTHIYIFPLFLLWLISHDTYSKPYTLFLAVSATKLCWLSIYCVVGLVCG